ncbi:uncharacterized protein LOC124286776 [Haliotis rubra]|uniref:uncharacterized protein LOC124286776 n=1 Tax=Haliotis rubra TaxID=36100 RepID=UPI001EE5E455|nr:uncharacterized protein LOC124286776 [Haliotis rubra]
MFRLYVLVTVLLATWNRDECVALTVAERTREQIKLARAAIRRSDMAPSYLRIAHFGHPKGRGIVAGKDFDVGDFITYYHGKYCVEEPIFDEYTFDLKYRRHAAWQVPDVAFQARKQLK